MQRIYMDYNSTTPLLPKVQEVYIKELNFYTNASSLYEGGRLGAKKIEKARKQVASLVGAHQPKEIVFTASGTESTNTIFNTMIFEGKKRNRNLIVTTKIEHPAVIQSVKRLKSFGFECEYLPVTSEGFVNIESYETAMNKKPLLVSIMTANNEIGTIMNIKNLCQKAHAAGALFHTDAVQAVGKIPFNAKEMGIDYASFSAHKIYGPKGVGALYIKEKSPIQPLLCGGEQEFNLRAGTYNVVGIVAFGVAAEEALLNVKANSDTIKKLRNRLANGLLKAIPNSTINGPLSTSLNQLNKKNNASPALRELPNTLNVSFPGAEGESILLHLDLLGISVSTGSACASASLDASHVLVAIGLDPALAHSSIRFSIGMFTTEKEIDFVVRKVPVIIDQLRKMSPFYT